MGCIEFCCLQPPEKPPSRDVGSQPNALREPSCEARALGDEGEARQGTALRGLSVCLQRVGGKERLQHILSLWTNVQGTGPHRPHQPLLAARYGEVRQREIHGYDPTGLYGNGLTIS